MRLPLKVASVVRARKLLPPGARILVALSGGPDSVALLLCLRELARKRDFRFSVAAAHLNHGLRGAAARRDQAFCRRLCTKRETDYLEAHCDVRRLAAHLKRSVEEAGRIARRAFLRRAARALGCSHIAVAHQADDRIETVLYRLCRGSGLAGLSGIRWTDPLAHPGEPDVGEWLTWQRRGRPGLPPFVPPESQPPRLIVRPLLACRRDEVLDYLRAQRQTYCKDVTNLDTRIPRNALRHLVLPLLERKVHPGVRAALWRLAEEAEYHVEERAWRRGWLQAIAALATRGYLALPVPQRSASLTSEELQDVVNLLSSFWRLRRAQVTAKHIAMLRGLFGPSGAARRVELPGGLIAERRAGEVWLRRALARHAR
jgi:tRNA(Ile)-lysidine synthase